jgi:ubiquinone/menaquinone biosynthesis C-methylase UbiE
MFNFLIQRNLTNKLNWILDNLVPPVLRDSRWFATLLFWPLFGKKTPLFMEFKQKAPFLSHKQYGKYYEKLSDVHLKRETDLNDPSIKKILKAISGKTVLDIGCGRGFLAKKIASKKTKVRVTGLDIIIPNYLKNTPRLKFVTGDVEKLPFGKKTFDVVVCTHTLEHVQNPQRVLSEMRRVAKKKIIIVVPRQKEYQYTFDLHLNFFPYQHSLEKLTKNARGTYLLLDNDWFYEETLG